MNFFKKSEIEEIVVRMRNGLKNGGFVYASVLSTDDPRYKILRSRQTPIEELGGI